MAAKSEKEMKEWIDAFKVGSVCNITSLHNSVLFSSQLASGLKRLSSEAAAHRDAATVASGAAKH